MTLLSVHWEAGWKIFFKKNPWQQLCASWKGPDESLGITGNSRIFGTSQSDMMSLLKCDVIWSLMPPPPPPCLSYLVPLFARSDLAQPYHATLSTLHIETLRLVSVPLSPMWEKRKINRKYLRSQPSLFAMVNLKIRLFSILIYFHVRVFLEYKGWNAKKKHLAPATSQPKNSPPSVCTTVVYISRLMRNNWGSCRMWDLAQPRANRLQVRLAQTSPSTCYSSLYKNWNPPFPTAVLMLSKP